MAEYYTPVVDLADMVDAAAVNARWQSLEDAIVGLRDGTIAHTDLNVVKSDSATNTVTNVLTVTHNSSGTPAASFGTGLVFKGESSTTEDTLMGRLRTHWTTATHASRKARLTLSAYDTAERDALAIEASGSAPMVGFFGVNPVVRPGVTDDIKDALVSLGLLQGTSPTPLNLDGGTVTTAGITASNTAGNYRAVTFQTSGSNRSIFGVDNAAESGANAGSNFVLVNYDDSGVYLNTPLTITRATGVTMLTNLGIGGSTLGTSAANVLMLKNGTAPGSSPADSVQLYAEDVASSSELRVRDEAGNVTTLSPHNPQMVDATGRITNYVHKEYNPSTGHDIELDIFGALQAVETLTGQTYIYSRPLAPTARENPFLRRRNQRRAALQERMHHV